MLSALVFELMILISQRMAVLTRSHTTVLSMYVSMTLIVQPSERENKGRPALGPQGLVTPRNSFTFSFGTEHSEGFVLLKETDLSAHRPESTQLASSEDKEGRERRKSKASLGP